MVQSVIAGCLIGWLNETWLARAIIPLVWGVAYVLCCPRGILRVTENEYENRMRELHGPPSRRWEYQYRYYNIKYSMASLTSLACSLLAGIARAFWQ